MQKLTENITSIYGENGKNWLSTLPAIVKKLQHYWNLENLQIIENQTYNYLLKANRANQAVVLKLAYDKKTFIQEKNALLMFAGPGMVKLLDSHEEHQALLLEQATPGFTLKSLYITQPQLAMQNYAQLLEKLPKISAEKEFSFSSVADWLTILDHTEKEHLPKKLLSKAIRLKNSLLKNPTELYLLHGDLHLDNILQQQQQWIAIDPKGVIGEREFEICCFDFNLDLLNTNKIETLFQHTQQLAELTHTSAARLRLWIFVRLLLHAAWAIEDNSDPSPWLELAEIAHNIL